MTLDKFFGVFVTQVSYRSDEDIIPIPLCVIGRWNPIKHPAWDLAKLCSFPKDTSVLGEPVADPHRHVDNSQPTQEPEIETFKEMLANR